MPGWSTLDNTRPYPFIWPSLPPGYVEPDIRSIQKEVSELRAELENLRADIRRMEPSRFIHVPTKEEVELYGRAPKK